MKTMGKNAIEIDNEMTRENIIKSVIASFRIESIHISETTAHEIYEKVRKRLKK